MGIGVIADLVTGVCDIAGDRGQAVGIGAADKEGRGNAVARQDLQDRRRGFGRAVIERQSEGMPGGIAAPYAWREHTRRPAAHRPTHEPAGRRNSKRSPFPHDYLLKEYGPATLADSANGVNPYMWTP